MNNELVSRKPLRLWPGVAVVIVMAALWLMPLVAPDFAIWAVLGGVVGGLIVLLWWLLFSRAPWIDRIGAIAVMAAAVMVAKFFVHPSIAGGMMGLMLFFYSIPVFSVALVLSAWLARGWPTGRRRVSIVVSILAGCALFALVRTDGVTGTGTAQLRWRWTPTAEQKLISGTSDTKVVEATKDKPLETPAAVVTPPAAIAAAPVITAEWPGFRGPRRDSAVRTVRIDTDWSRTTPRELWHRPVGPGWSSFAVRGDLIYTQEQRGDHEQVSCYRLATGESVWTHSDPVRFYESNGGAGPRGTPTVHGNRVYAFGATGLLNALDARTGARIWSHDAGADAQRQIPGWGFSSSPLVVDDIVVVAASGDLVAYDLETGRLRWKGPTGSAGGYSSPHLMTFDGVTQIVLLTGAGAQSVSPSDGRLLWEHSWQEGVSIVQPGVIDGDILISGGDAMGGLGIRRLAVSLSSSGWTTQERWTTRGLKPYFNDFVVHKGHAYGFDGTILAAIDLADGTRKWKGGRYGAGQILLLSNQDLLLVVSEEGELALVKAAPDGYGELARVPAIEGKTWNHPVLVGDVLLVRNGEAMAAFRLPTAR